MIKTLRLIILIGSLFSTPAHSQSPYVDLSGGHLEPTLLRVLSDPQKYHGKDIQIIAFLRLEFEGDGLWLHREDYMNAILGNAIWVSASQKMEKNRNTINNNYVIIRGTFDANNHGHMGLYSGALNNITRCDLWSDPKKPKAAFPIPPPLPPSPSQKKK